VKLYAGTVNCLSFSPNGSHLLSGADDGNIAVFRTGSWQLEKVFAKAHKGEGKLLKYKFLLNKKIYVIL
jgi:WD40 repeat protein